MKELWVYGNCLTRDQAEEVNRLAAGLPVISSTVSRSKVVDNTKRKSSIRWINRSDPQFTWLFTIVDKRISYLNRECHQVDYDYDGCEAFQYTEYTVGDFYGPHVDTFFLRDNVKLRKLSASILLSDPTEFEGGDLRIEGVKMDPKEGKIGQIHTFPSILMHEALPVTRGIRRSLVAWYLGPPWR